MNVRSVELYPVGGVVTVSDPEYFKLLEERDAMREALIGLDEAYCRAGVGLTREERIEDRKRLIAARKAVGDTRS